MDNYYVKIPHSWYDNLDMSNEEVTILILLYRNYMQYKSISLCSIALLTNYMRFNTSNNRKVIGDIKNIISSLIEKNFITSLYDMFYNAITTDDISDKNYIFYVELPITPETEWFQICDNDLNKIFEALENTNVNKFNLIRYFIACRRVVSCESNFGYLTQAKLKQLINDSRTIKKYNKILQDELHLIRYCNDYLTPEKHYCTTFIGYWDDEENFNHQLKVAVENQKLIHTTKIKSNKKRSIKQKINNLENNADTVAALKELEQYKAIYGELNKKSINAEDKVIKMDTHIGKINSFKNRDSIKQERAVNFNADFMNKLLGNDTFDQDNDNVPESIRLTQKMQENNDDELPF